MTINHKIIPRKWGVTIELIVRPVVSPKNSRDVERYAWAVLIPIIRKAALEAGVNLVAPGPHEPMLAGYISGNPPLGATSFTLGQHVIFMEYNIPPEREWRTATDWLFHALENISSETIQVISITELILGA